MQKIFVPNTLTAYVIDYQRTGDRRTMNLAAQEINGFIHSCANRIASTTHDNSISADDLYCAGWSGFMRAVEKYDASTGYQFLTYATRRIRGSMLDERRKLCPAYKRRKNKHIRNENDGIFYFDDSLDPDESAFHEYTQQGYRSTLSLDTLLSISDNGNSPLSFLDAVISTPDHLASLVTQQEESDVHVIMLWVLNLLDPRERYVLIYNFLLKRSLRDIAYDFDRSESLVCQIKKRALQKIDYIMRGTPMKKRVRKRKKL